MPRLHKGLLVALVVPPPPTPPILLETSLRITRELNLHRKEDHNRGPDVGPGSRPIFAGQPPPPLVALRCAAPPASLLAIIIGKVLTLGAFRIPAAPNVHRLTPSALGLRREPFVDLGHYGPAALSPRGTLRQLNLLQEDRNITMSFPKAQSVTSASAVPKRRLITPESAILRHGTRTVV